MDELITEIRGALDAGLNVLALMGTLALVDICGAVESENGTATASKFKTWLKANVPGQAANADNIYGLRCSLLHQGRALPHGARYPVAFTVPGGPQIHGGQWIAGSDQITFISIPIFVDEVTHGAEAWLAKYGNTQNVQKNLNKFARLHPNGLSPWTDFPIIA